MSYIYTIPLAERTPEGLLKILDSHPEIQFISLLAVDFGNNHTDEKIPIDSIRNDLKGFFENGIQTDGSSVNLPEIASINNAKVDLIPDLDAHWVVDYNPLNILESGMPCGSLVIPAFLFHNGKAVCSRSLLKAAGKRFEDAVKALFTAHPHLLEDYADIPSADAIDSVSLTAATELEFWVRTPDTKTDLEKLTTSQHLKEQYWKRTIGQVRTATEQSLAMMARYGLEPEMGHKEVGGVHAKLSGINHHTHIMEQLEIDWKYDTMIHTADKECFAKNIVKDVFEANGLSVTFQAKPVEGVAGSGEHHHLGVAVTLKNGKRVNVFSPKRPQTHFMSRLGYGALMGILKNYEVINPFVSSTNDSLNRLKPGFEAPVCIVSSLGQSPDQPSRNRTVLVGLVRDLNAPLATRFELRSPNPNSNSYLLLAAACQAALDGMEAVAQQGLSLDAVEAGFSKEKGEAHFYLDADRVYRTEDDVFEDYSAAERDARFGKPPRTVYENLLAFERYPEKTALLQCGDVFTDAIIGSYKAYMLSEWHIELTERILPTHINTLRQLVKLHGDDDVTDLDIVQWEQIRSKKHMLMKDSLDQKSLFTRIRNAIADADYDLASRLQVEMNAHMSAVVHMYLDYKRNLLHIS